jgi:pimeloyl-ACP methyl ester carboxylesterase
MPRYQTLMPIRTKGSSPPLFCVHGQPLRIAQRLNPDRPIYGLSHVYHSDFLDEMPESIEQLAAQYLSDIRLVQPNGPYHICGFSAGGMIAFEIARQLREDGDTIGTLLLIEPTVEVESVSLSGKVASTMLESGGLFAGLRQLLIRVFRSVKARTRIYSRTLVAKGYFVLKIPLPESLRWIGYLKSLGPAMNKYEYKPVECRATLLYQSMDDEYRDATADYWENLFLQGATVKFFPDAHRHEDFMIEPSLSQTVELIDQLAV